MSLTNLNSYFNFFKNNENEDQSKNIELYSQQTTGFWNQKQEMDMIQPIEQAENSIGNQQISIILFQDGQQQFKDQIKMNISVNNYNEISIIGVIKQLKYQGFDIIDGTQIMIFEQSDQRILNDEKSKKVFYFVGNYPNICDYYVSYESIKNSDLIIKYRPAKKRYIDQLCEEIQDNEKEQYADNFGLPNELEQNIKKNKRIKERTIRDVIEKVAIWRKLYSGFFDDEDNYIQYSLEEASKKVGVAKKTLDDYLYQLRQGNIYGYDFNKNQFKKVGDLRKFMRDSGYQRNKRNKPQQFKVNKKIKKD